MKPNSGIWGWVLVGLGALFLLQNLGLQVAGPIWGLVFAAAGVAFLWWYRQNPANWWASIPGFTLLGLGVLILFEPLFGGAWGGAVFLGAIGLGFLAVYVVKREHWWALIPGGTLLTLAMVAAQGDKGGEGGALFFTGLALTFGAVFLVGQRWAVFPALACAVLIFVTSDFLRGVMAWALPLALVAVGVYLLSRGRGGQTGQGGHV
jgi:hypothetical protein